MNASETLGLTAWWMHTLLPMLAFPAIFTIFQREPNINTKEENLCLICQILILL